MSIHVDLRPDARRELLRETDTYGRHSLLGDESTIDVHDIVARGTFHPSFIRTDYVGRHRVDWHDAQQDWATTGLFGGAR